MSTDSDARREILRRVRVAIGGPSASGDIPRAYRQESPSPGRLELFVERVGDYRATVRRVGRGDLPAAVAEALASRGIIQVVTPAGIPPDWLSLAQATVLTDDPPLDHAAIDGAGAVITGCALAIAETGTIVLDAGPSQGRRALTLLPDVHICVVDSSRIVMTVPEAVALLDPKRPQTWISGPSATSDIELERVEGVHGPRDLEVLVVGPVEPGNAAPDA